MHHGTESIPNLGPKIEDHVPNNLKEKLELNKFKKVINNQWKHEDCPCRLCKIFVQNVGFLEKLNLKEAVTSGIKNKLKMLRKI